jgi:lipid-A-disaccharide synthase
MTSPSESKNFRIMLVAGEASGDKHAAALVGALSSEHPDVAITAFGATGPAMRTAGVESVIETDHLAIMGLYEVGRTLGKFWNAFQQLKVAARRERPDAVILVDWPEFNLRLARALHRQGLRVIYYISPQLWAWRSYRVRSIRRDVDLLLTILPFEKEWYRRRGVEHVEYVGHPLAGEVNSRFGRAEFCERNDLDTNRPVVALLAGSRHKEVVRILPVLLRACVELHRARPDLQFVIPLAPNRPRAETDKLIAAARIEAGKTLPEFTIVEQQTTEAVAAATVAVVASGTATLETAILGTPLLVVYKESAVNWKLFRWMIDVEHFGLVNLVGGERVATELMQHDLTEENISAEVLRLLEPETNHAFRRRLAEIKHSLGEANASHRAAELVVDALHSWKR